MQRERVQALGKAYEAAEKPTRKMREQLDKERRSLKRLGEAYDKNKGALRDTKSQMRTFGLTVDNIRA